MAIEGLTTRTFGAHSERPVLATIYDCSKENIPAGYSSSFPDRQVRISDYVPGVGFKNQPKLKTVDKDCFTIVGAVNGNVDKLICYSSDGGQTMIAKGLNQGVGIEKGNYAYLRRVLPDGDVIDLTMKQGKNGKYETIAIESLNNKSISEFPKVKEMLLNLDPLVKRFIKVVK